MSLIFTTTCNKDYHRAWIFQSLSKLGGAVAALLHPDDKRELPSNVWRMPFVSDRFYQQGTFIDAMAQEIQSDDWDNQVIMLADADAVIQRDLNDDERLMLDNLGDGFAIGYNMHPRQTGAEEQAILRLAVDKGYAANALRLTTKVLDECPMFNFGLVAGKVSTWRRLRKLYAHHTEACSNPQVLFVNPTWMQYVICAIIYAAGIPVVPMPYSMHSHQHFTMTPEHHVRQRVLYYRYAPVFFAHYVAGVTH